MATGKTVLITGVSKGLGRAMACGFAARGHRVVGCARDLDALKSLGEELGLEHQFTQVDVADDDEVRDWAATILPEVGPPDLLVNSAAVINRNAPLWEIDADEFGSLIDINIKGVASVIRHFLPAMIEESNGVVVNFSSGWGRSTSPDVAPYCASKWAIEGMTQAMAQELPSGMAAVAFNPGIIDTDMLRNCFGTGASSYDGPGTWANAAVPFLEGLGPSDNGRALTCPGQ